MSRAAQVIVVTVVLIAALLATVLMLPRWTGRTIEWPYVATIIAVLILSAIVNLRKLR